MINLGTQKHKDKYFSGIDSVDYPGCFAMTELHHGKGGGQQLLAVKLTGNPVEEIIRQMSNRAEDCHLGDF